MKVLNLLRGATATGAGIRIDASELPSNRTFQLDGTTSSGSGAATVNVEVSNDGANFVRIGTISLTLGTASTNDGFQTDAAWSYVRGNVVSISGTGAAISLNMGA